MFNSQVNSNIQRVFKVNNGTDMKTLLPNDYRHLSAANFFLASQSFTTNNFESPHNLDGTSYFVIRGGVINTGEINYNVNTGIVSISAPKWTANVTPGSGGYTFGLNFPGSGTPEAICIYPAP